MFRSVALGVVAAFAWFGYTEMRDGPTGYIAACMDAGFSKDSCTVAEQLTLYGDVVYTPR